MEQDPAQHVAPETEPDVSYPLANLLEPPSMPPCPDDFAEFWQQSYATLTRPRLADRIEFEHDSGERPVQRISFWSSAGVRTLAWLAGPRYGVPARRGLVVGHGYGGRSQPEVGLLPADTAAIFPVAPWLAINDGAVDSGVHVLRGIADRHRYALRYSAADLWRSTSVLLQRYPSVDGCLDYRGGSFGGGIGALAFPWDDRLRRACLNVPSFGHHAIRLTRVCTGSGEAVRQHLLKYPRHRSTLDYFDAATAATMITKPVLVAAARKDPAVDPRGQFAVFHGLEGPKRLLVRTAGHAEFPGQQAEEIAAERAQQRFLTADDVAGIPRLTDLSRS